MEESNVLVKIVHDALMLGCWIGPKDSLALRTFEVSEQTAIDTVDVLECRALAHDCAR